MAAAADGAPGLGNGPQVLSTSAGLEIQCGPLINYKHTTGATTEAPFWHGSVLIVTHPGQPQPTLSFRCVGALGPDPSIDGQTSWSAHESRGEKLYEDPHKAFWRFLIAVPFQSKEAQWSYTIPGARPVDGSRNFDAFTFTVPSKAHSMRILFHSCNGFSVGTDEDYWSGPALWNDVLRNHAAQPFHVMIGGGDQIYNDSVRVKGPLKPWTDIGNPEKRRKFPFNEQMRSECDKYYFDNYVKWYAMEPFCTANAQIPQINIWDDHDIIDGFGSYTDHFMRCSVFRGIGGVAHKYYMLFQHHIAPPATTYSTEVGAPGEQNPQLKESWVLKETEEDPSMIIGTKPGPYVEERSRNIYCQLGRRIAFAGIDARTERTRHQINYPETYKVFFARIHQELEDNPEIKHLILLLGVPIAYPRLQWLENILQSPIIGPIRFLNRRFGFAGGLFNQFDGGVDLLDDLDDHYTAHQHKHERRDLIHMLQEVSRKHSVRVSILGGDVHLCAVGRFFSKASLGIPADNDWRYMPNIVSSAITNKPPPAAVANLLAKRNKIHHLDHQTDETLLEIFDRNPGTVDADGNPTSIAKKTVDSNRATMPSRNYAIINESNDAMAAAVNGATAHVNGNDAPADPTTHKKTNPRQPIHPGEADAGTAHPAASGAVRSGLCGQHGLDVTLRVEITNSDREGHTDGYGFSLPALNVSEAAKFGATA